MSLDSSHSGGSLFDRTWDRFEIMVGGLARSPTTTHPRGNPRSGGGGDPSKESHVDSKLDLIELGVELSLRVLIAVTSGYLMMYITKKFFGPLLPGGEDQDSDAAGVPASAVYRRLAVILSKRDDPGGKRKQMRRHVREQQLALPALSSYERQMAQEIVDPDDIEATFADIGGLDNTKREIYELAILPLVRPELFARGKLVQPCKGILLYGKPGTGKTMLAKALAKEARAVFLPLQLSKILNKWVGESNKLIAATFSLANKLQPAIIFIDELDTFLKANNSETAYLDSIKAEFLTLWDGISTSQNARVLVLGATNKPHTIDPAILRRMPRAFLVPLPDEKGRLSILSLLLQDENVSDDAMAFLPELAAATNGYSGSDLKEMCKAAAMIPVQERTEVFARDRVMGRGDADGCFTGNDNAEGDFESLRPISREDLIKALRKVQRTGAAATSYGRRQVREESYSSGADISSNSLRGLTSLLRSLSVLSTNNGNDDGIGEDGKNDGGDDDGDDEGSMPEV